MGTNVDHEHSIPGLRLDNLQRRRFHHFQATQVIVVHRITCDDNDPDIKETTHLHPSTGYVTCDGTEKDFIIQWPSTASESTGVRLARFFFRVDAHDYDTNEFLSFVEQRAAAVRNQ